MREKAREKRPNRRGGLPYSKATKHTEILEQQRISAVLVRQEAQVAAQAGTELSRMRLDRYVCSLQLDGLENRSRLKHLKAEVWKDGALLKFSHLVENGEELLIRWQEPESFDARCAVPMDLDILYEDADLVLLNKPYGLAVHGAVGLREPSLVQGLIAKYQDLPQNFGSGGAGADRQEENGTDVSEHEFRPGIVHRLDKDTSGVLLVARNSAGLRNLSGQFAARRVQKTYYALVHGCPTRPAGRVDLPLMRDPKAPQRYTVYQSNRLIGRFGGRTLCQEELAEFYADCEPGERPKGLRDLKGLKGSENGAKWRTAETEYRVVRSWQFTEGLPDGRKQQVVSLIRLRPGTGRTHQLRVHAKHLGCPIVGDPIYGKRQEDRTLARLWGLPQPSLMLHAFRLEFYHPEDGRAMRGQAAVPARFRNWLQCFFGGVPDKAG
ncbi:RluA family pseudouridine synthase [Candidatus Haliotispira prima]|uniref:RluA family pseudouridine synthase n=1 Tax=Candidatus Haliotispira prima TaxID=3034016 RepID=A0ABY8MK83_9SPIO|nr:RluA family pseudouridine synthase [Candidatus Haliotispira prima]